MPTRAKQQCNQAGCRELTDARYCAAHQRDNTHRADRQAFDQQRQNDPHRKLRAGSQWRRTREFVLARDPICCDCHREASVEVDHIIMARLWCATLTNDYYDTNNLQGLCHSCHSRKTARETRFAGRQEA